MALRIDNIVWQDHIMEKIQSKHGIYPEDVENALGSDDPKPFIERKGDRYVACCRVPDSGQYILVIFAFVPPDMARIISAYDMPDSYRSKYRKWLGY